MHSKWPEIESRVRARWSRLTSNDMRMIAGRREHLVRLLQKHYGKNLAEIERQVSQFEAKTTV